MMTAEDLAKQLGCSRPWIFILKKKFPGESPRSFDDVEGWKIFLRTIKARARVKHVRGATQPRESTVGNGSGPELSDIARLTKARANKVETEHEILMIELAATKRQVVRQEEVITIFAQLATVVRGRLMKMKNDLPSALLGLDAPSIDKVVSEKMEQVLAPFRIPDDFFNSKGLV